MKNDSPQSTGTILADTTSATAHLQAEIDEMRRRLVALEAHAPAHANPTFDRKRRWGATPKRLALMIAGVTLAGATIVFGQSAVDSLFVGKDGKVGIGTTAPANKLSVAGNADFSGNVDIGTTGAANKLSVAGNADFNGKVSIRTATPGVALEIGQNQAIRLGNANISSGGDFVHLSNHAWYDGAAWQSDGTAGALYQISAQTHNWYLHDGKGVFGKVMTIQPNGNVGIGNITPQAKLDVAGNMRVAGTIVSQGRYQRDDAPEAAYEVSPRYHLSLTANIYGGSTRQIPQQVINDLCGDQDGCEFRLGMTRWDANTETETASITGIFYYSTSDGHWRTSMVFQDPKVEARQAIGIDGNKKTEHVGSAWNTCFFTDSPYSKYQDQSDPTIGMYLLVWNVYTNPGRTCELTLID